MEGKFLVFNVLYDLFAVVVVGGGDVMVTVVIVVGIHAFVVGLFVFDFCNCWLFSMVVLMLLFLLY